MHYQHQVDIQRPVSEVFEYMDDVEREREWQPGIKEARQEPPGPTGVGTRKSYVSEFMGRRVENTYVTKVFERDRHVVYETTSDSTLQATAELRWESVGPATRVTMSVEAKVRGALRFVPATLLERMSGQELEASLRMLKERLEAGTRSQGP